MEKTPSHYYQKGLFITLGLLGFVITASTWLASIDADRMVASWFYTPPKEWLLWEMSPWMEIYRFGTIPGVTLAMAAVIGLIVTFFRPQHHAWRRYLLVVILTSVVGVAILINALLKDNWGRPRPRQTTDFGGRWNYQQFYEPGVPGKGKSFPCGHCGISFAFLSAIYLHRRSRLLAWSGGLTGLVYGTLVSIARIGQGAHFVTDALWSFGVVSITATILYYWVLQPPLHDEKHVPLSWERRKQLILGFLVSLLIMAFFFLTRRPIFEDHRHTLLVDGVQEVIIETNLTRSDIQVLENTESEQGVIQTWAQGFGWPNSYNQLVIDRRIEGSQLIISYELTAQGYFSENSTETFLYLPKELHSRVTVIPANVR